MLWKKSGDYATRRVRKNLTPLLLVFKCNTGAKGFVVGYSLPNYVPQNINLANLEKGDGMDGSMIKHYIL